MQARGWLWEDCIAIQSLVLQPAGLAKGDCVSIHKVYRDIGRAGAGCRALGARGCWASGRKALGLGMGRRAVGGQTRGARSRGAQGARQEQQARGLTSGDTVMLAYNTAEGPVATRPRLLRHGASARGHARPGRGLGAGWACWLGQPGQVGALCTWLSFDFVFGPGLTQYCS